MPTNDNDLETLYNEQEIEDVGLADGVYVGQIADNEFALHQFRNDVGDSGTCTLTWEGRTNNPPSSSPVYLQVFNRVTNSWETLTYNNTALVNVNFILTAEIDPDNYKDLNNFITARVYQQG